MNSSEKSCLEVSGNCEIPIDIVSCGKELNMEIVNQYGQLMGEFSKLDDELWLTSPGNDEAIGFPSNELELNHVPSHLHEHIADLQSPKFADNSLTYSGMTSVENNSSFLNGSSQNPSRTLSPVSVLQRTSFCNETTFIIKRTRSKHNHSPTDGSRSRFSDTEAGHLFQPINYMEPFALDETTDPYPLRTRKVSDLLQLDYGDRNLSNPGTTLKQKSPTEFVKKCVHCQSEKTPQWRDGPIGRKTLCNACGIRYKKDLLSADCRPLRTQKKQKKAVKKCVHCHSANTLQWREGPKGPGTLCNACGIQYKKTLRFADYHPLRTPRFDASPPTNLSKIQKVNFEEIAAKTSHSSLCKTKVQEKRMAEDSEIDRDCTRKTITIQDMTGKTDDMIDSGSRYMNKEPIFNTVPIRRLPAATVKKCEHCESTQTPQWREGPMGRNTLCNACGVQFRNGRLFPEYRPLKSPSYDPSLHSHLPKRVAEMRMLRIREERAKSENSEQAA